MGRSIYLWAGLAAIAGGVLFHTSYRVQELERELAGLHRDIIAEQEHIQVLKAEWSILNDPERLQRLVTQHLALEPTGSAKIAGFDSLPFRTPPVQPAPPVAFASFTVPAARADAGRPFWVGSADGWNPLTTAAATHRPAPVPLHRRITDQIGVLMARLGVTP